MDSICQNSGKQGNENPQIRGFGFYDIRKYRSFGGYHPGLDFFGYPPAQNANSRSSVFSIADSGVVAGIGLQNRTEQSSERWGATGISGSGGYSVIVRYGHLYVLYGHLLELDRSIYVGRLVNKGTRLGSIGTAIDEDGNVSLPHIHIEVRSFGQTIRRDSLVVQDGRTRGNDYGLLRIGGRQADSFYDIAQFFVYSPSANIQDKGSGIGTISPFGVSIQNQTPVTFGPTCVIQYLTDPTTKAQNATLNGTPVPTLRAFKLGSGGRGSSDDPLVTPDPASFQ